MAKRSNEKLDVKLAAQHPPLAIQKSQKSDQRPAYEKYKNHKLGSE